MRRTKQIVLALAAMLALGTVWTRPAQATATTSYMDIQVTFSCSLSVSVDGIQDSSYTTTAGNVANAFATPATSATVKNDSTCASAKWMISASTLSPAGQPTVAGWTLNNATGTTHTESASACTAVCPGAEQYSVQALFVSSNTLSGAYANTSGACPSMSSATWAAVVSTVPVTPGWSKVAGDPVTGPSQYVNSQYGANNYIGFGSGLPDNSPSAGYMLPYSGTTGVGQRGLCARVTLPSTTVLNGTPQIIRLAISATP